MSLISFLTGGSWNDSAIFFLISQLNRNWFHYYAISQQYVVPPRTTGTTVLFTRLSKCLRR